MLLRKYKLHQIINLLVCQVWSHAMFIFIIKFGYNFLHRRCPAIMKERRSSPILNYCRCIKCDVLFSALSCAYVIFLLIGKQWSGMTFSTFCSNKNNPAKTRVSSAVAVPYTRLRLMTKSISHRRFRRIEKPIVMGTLNKNKTNRALKNCINEVIVCFFYITGLITEFSKRLSHSFQANFQLCSHR